MVLAGIIWKHSEIFRKKLDFSRMVTVTERDIDDLTDIYINKVIYPEGELDDDNGETEPRVRAVLEMPRSIFVTKVSLRRTSSVVF